MRKAKIAVAMSGGVDSSVAAALLKKEGNDLLGVTMEVTGESNEKAVLNRAEKICDFLKIPFFTVDLKAEFKTSIKDYFYSRYVAGLTPNPCILCNPLIKFGKLMEKSRELGADFFATGHYVKVKKDPLSNKFCLYRGADPSKDQAYALYRLSQSQLSCVLFPLGSLNKKTVKRIAEEMGIPLDDKGESQEICFIPDNNYPEYLMKNYGLKPSPGPILDINGKIIGTHRGLVYYTTGQRRGLGIAGLEPLYVVRMDYSSNSIVAGRWDDLFSRSLQMKDCVWNMEPPDCEMRVFCQIRYRHKAAPGILKIGGAGSEVVFDEPQRAVTPGQSAVIYSYPDGEKVLGGGIIITSINIA